MRADSTRSSTAWKPTNVPAQNWLAPPPAIGLGCSVLDDLIVPVVHSRLTASPLKLAGSCRPEHVVGDDGREWVRKKHVDGLGVQISGEVVGALLATKLGIPIPEYATSERPRAWLSRWAPGSSPWSEAHNTDLVNEPDLGRILALDAVLLNTDRSARNILVTIDPEESSWRVSAIDFGMAGVSFPARFNIDRDRVLQRGPLPRSVPAHRVHEEAIECAHAAADLTSWTIKQVCAQACALSGNTMEATMAEVLEHRCRNAVRFVEGYFRHLAEPES
jgi:hypothetical protein